MNPILLRDGALAEDPEQPWLDLQDLDTLDQLNAASVRYRIAIGPGAGQRTLILRHPALVQPCDQGTPKPFTVNRDGFSLNAAPSAIAPHTFSSPRLTSSPRSPAPRSANPPIESPQAGFTDLPTAPLTSAQRLKWGFEIDITLRPLCGGRLRDDSRLHAPFPQPSLCTRKPVRKQPTQPTEKRPRQSFRYQRAYANFPRTSPRTQSKGKRPANLPILAALALLLLSAAGLTIRRKQTASS